VTVDRPGQQRVTVLWNGDASTTSVAIPRLGATAQACQMDGATYPLASLEEEWVLALPGATAHFQLSDPDGYHYIGGKPIFVIEEGVEPASPVVAPRLV
jgi:hypothetical protein